jgi:excisionase family DNA binding protein
VKVLPAISFARIVSYSRVGASLSRFACYPFAELFSLPRYRERQSRGYAARVLKNSPLIRGEPMTTHEDTKPTPNSAQQQPQQLIHTVKEACQLAKIGRSKLDAEIKAGSLRARKLGKRVMILHADLVRWLEALPAVRPALVDDVDA